MASTCAGAGPGDGDGDGDGDGGGGGDGDGVTGAHHRLTQITQMGAREDYRAHGVNMSL